MLRVPTTLSPATEELIHRTIGCCIAVHRALGPGLLESIYARACCVELQEARVPFELEKRIPIRYRGRLLCHHRMDFVVGGQIVVEIKAIDRLAPVHYAQVMSYLRASGLRVGLLLNFNVAVLPEGLRRIVL